MIPYIIDVPLRFISMYMVYTAPMRGRSRCLKKSPAVLFLFFHIIVSYYREIYKGNPSRAPKLMRQDAIVREKNRAVSPKVPIIRMLYEGT